jgi:hypothetical protein
MRLPCSFECESREGPKDASASGTICATFLLYRLFGLSGLFRLPVAKHPFYWRIYTCPALCFNHTFELNKIKDHVIKKTVIGTVRLA